MYEILTRWSGPGAPGKTTVMYFSESVAIGIQRTRLANFWDAVDSALDSNMNWTIEPSGRIISAATGTMTGVWSDALVHSGSGAAAGQSIADAAQVLFRWKTNAIVNGRFVQGRTFVPGLANTNTSEGNLNAVVRGNYIGAANTLLGNPNSLEIWHRPPPGGSSGSAHQVTAADVWAEFAVLRRRRG